MAAFVQYISSDMIAKEVLLDLVRLRKTTRGIAAKNALDEALTITHVPLKTRQCSNRWFTSNGG